MAMPADTNANGDIFGGWLLGQMDIGGGMFASKMAQSRTVTVAIEADELSRGSLRRRPGFRLRRARPDGRTSVTFHLEAWALRRKEAQWILVTDGGPAYVSIDDSGPQAIKRQARQPIAT